MNQTTMGLQDEYNQIVTFNVGGTHYEVSRSLINQFPDTMLARLSSETWSPQTDDGDSNYKGAPLFIERDGERFRYCLDYMRDGGIVDLPATVSKAALLRDLEYYGFHDVDPSAISQPLPSYDERLRDYKQLQQDAIVDQDLKMLADACGNWLTAGSRTALVECKEEEGFIRFVFLQVSRKQGRTYHNKICDTALKLFYKTSKHEWHVSRFNKHLKPKGLKFREKQKRLADCIGYIELHLDRL